MKITLAVATSQDGYINHEGEKNAAGWTSAEDKALFARLLSDHNLLLMGRTTYEHMKDHMQHTPGRRRVVFTHTPDAYAAIPGMLEFTDEALPTAITRLEQEGFSRGLLLGGGVLYTAFLEAGLVDELYQTVEPQQFGGGVPFLTNGSSLADMPGLSLHETTKLNYQGTLLLHYIRS